MSLGLECAPQDLPALDFSPAVIGSLPGSGFMARPCWLGQRTAILSRSTAGTTAASWSQVPQGRPSAFPTEPLFFSPCSTQDKTVGATLAGTGHGPVECTSLVRDEDTSCRARDAASPVGEAGTSARHVGALPVPVHKESGRAFGCGVGSGLHSGQGEQLS